MGSTGESFFSRIKSFAQQEKPERKGSFMHSIPGLGKKDEKSNIPLGSQGEDESEKQYGSAQAVDNLAEQRLKGMGLDAEMAVFKGLIQETTSLNMNKDALKRSLDIVTEKLRILERSGVEDWQARARQYRAEINKAIESNKSISVWFEEYYKDHKSQ